MQSQVLPHDDLNKNLHTRLDELSLLHIKWMTVDYHAHLNEFTNHRKHCW